jgi:Zn-dependent protease with chaperone function
LGFEEDGMRRWLWTGVVGLALAGQAVAMPLADAPTGLAWTAAEVAAASDDSAKQVIERAAAAGGVGCRSHCDVIDRVWRRLIAQLRAQPAAPRSVRWQLVVVQSDDVDAFAVPSGTIVLSESFLRRRQLDAPQIAFVVAHEAVHVLMQHERQTLTAALMLLPRGVARSVDDMYVEIDHNFGLLRLLEPVMQQVEFEADEFGLLLAVMAGFDPKDQLRFMASEARAGRERSIVATHPDAAERLRRLTERLPLALRLLPAAH